MSRVGAWWLATAALCTSGCGAFGLALGSERVMRVASVAVETKPVDATLWQRDGNDVLSRGAAPLTLRVPYEAQDQKTAFGIIGWSLGTAVDAGLMATSVWGATEARQEGFSALAVVGIVVSGLLLLTDMSALVDLGEQVEPRQIILLARHPGYSEAQTRITVPGSERAVLSLTKIEGLFGAPDNTTDRVLVLDLATPDLGPGFGNLLGRGVAHALQPRFAKLVLTSADLGQPTCATEKSAGAAPAADTAPATAEPKADGQQSTVASITCISSQAVSLGVTRLVTGEVRQSGKRVSVTLRLLAVPGGETVRQTQKTLFIDTNAEAKPGAVLLDALPDVALDLVSQPNPSPASVPQKN